MFFSVSFVQQLWLDFYFYFFAFCFMAFTLWVFCKKNLNLVWLNKCSISYQSCLICSCYNWKQRMGRLTKLSRSYLTICVLCYQIWKKLIWWNFCWNSEIILWMRLINPLWSGPLFFYAIKKLLSQIRWHDFLFFLCWIKKGTRWPLQKVDQMIFLLLMYTFFVRTTTTH